MKMYMDFNAKLGFPLLAKILLGTGMMLVMGLVAGVKRVIARTSSHLPA